MFKKRIEKAKEVIIHVPVELFEEAGIQYNNGYAMYCRNGEIVIKELIDDDDECCDEDENEDECDEDSIEHGDDLDNPTCCNEDDSGKNKEKRSETYD